MSRYKFNIEAHFTKNNYLEILEQEKKLFEVDGKKVMLKSLNKQPINKSEGIIIECGMFDNLESCISLAKKVYANFLLRLNLSHISYILDKYSLGNFCKYCTDSDSSIYKEIRIIDTLEKSDDEFAFLESAGSGCTHFKFDKLLDISLDKKIKNSLLINNYRKYLSDKELDSRIDNTLISASIEMLIDETVRNEAELNVIQEVCDYLNEKYKKTKLCEYQAIKQMVENNKHKSIRSLKEELVEKYSPKRDLKENLDLINIISKNRTEEIHVYKSDKRENVWADQLLFDIQYGYMKELKDKNNNGQ